MSTFTANKSETSLVPTVGGGAPVAPFPCPGEKTMRNAFELAVKQDRPIVMDYWLQSREKTVMIGVKEVPGEEPEKMLVKSEEEYTSPVAKIFKVGKEYIVMTENSIYIVDVEIPTKRISS
jgi:hypothetical protein